MRAGRRVRIKICGVTRRSDAELACKLGADAVGVVMVPGSAREVARSAALEIRRAVSGLTQLVALFADPEPDAVRAVAAWLRPDMLQFHGRETPDFCASFRIPYLKALSHSQARDWKAFETARGIIIDSHEPGEAGGTGQVFDWERFPRDSDRPLLLAGGLGPSNVARAIRIAGPYGVDVSSGIEAQPGIKDQAEMERFFSEVRRAERGE